MVLAGLGRPGSGGAVEQCSGGGGSWRTGEVWWPGWAEERPRSFSTVWGSGFWGELEPRRTGGGGPAWSLRGGSNGGGALALGAEGEGAPV